MKDAHEKLQISVSLDLVKLQARLWVGRSSYSWARLRKDGDVCVWWHSIMEIFRSYAAVFQPSSRTSMVSTVVSIDSVHYFISPTFCVRPHSPITRPTRSSCSSRQQGEQPERSSLATLSLLRDRFLSSLPHFWTATCTSGIRRHMG